MINYTTLSYLTVMFGTSCSFWLLHFIVRYEKKNLLIAFMCQSVIYDGLTTLIADTRVC